MGNVDSRKPLVPYPVRFFAESQKVSPSPPELRMVLLGKTGAGKTAAGNTILGREEFRSEASSSSITKMLEKGEQQIGGKLVSVMDTPGFSNTRLSEEAVKEEIERCISLSEDQKIEMFVQKNEFLKQLVEKCGGRCHVFNSQNRSDHTQVSELLEKIKEQYSSYTKIKRGKGKAPKTKLNKIKYILGVASAALAWALYRVKDLFIAYKKVEKDIPISAIKQDPKGFKLTLQLTFKFGAINIFFGVGITVKQIGYYGSVTSEFYLKIVFKTSQLENAFKAPVEGFKHTFKFSTINLLSEFYLKIVSETSQLENAFKAPVEGFKHTFKFSTINILSEFYLKILFKTSQLENAFKAPVEGFKHTFKFSTINIFFGVGITVKQIRYDGSGEIFDKEVTVSELEKAFKAPVEQQQNYFFKCYLNRYVGDSHQILSVSVFLLQK